MSRIRHTNVRTQATLAGGERSNLCAIPCPHLFVSIFFIISASVFLKDLHGTTYKTCLASHLSSLMGNKPIRTRKGARREICDQYQTPTVKEGIWLVHTPQNLFNLLGFRYIIISPNIKLHKHKFNIKTAFSPKSATCFFYVAVIPRQVCRKHYLYAYLNLPEYISDLTWGHCLKVDLRTVQNNSLNFQFS